MKMAVTCALAIAFACGAELDLWSMARAHAPVLQGPDTVRIQEASLRRSTTVSPTPEYPRASLERQIGGVAVAAVFIGLDGRTEKVEILEAPDSDIAAAVEAAMMRWVVPWQTGPAGESAKPRTSKLTFYFQITDGKGRVLNPAEMPGASGRLSSHRGPLPGSPPKRGVPPPPAGAPVARAGGQSRATKTITVAKLQKRAGTDPVLVLDIGEREAFKRGHWPDAINIPADELPVRGGIELSRSRAIVIDCTQEGMWKCQAAGSMLAEQGFTNVTLLVR